MAGQTQPTYHWPIPDYDDYADGPKAFQDLGNGVDLSLTGLQTQVTNNGTAITANGTAITDLQKFSPRYAMQDGNDFGPITGTALVSVTSMVLPVVAGAVYEFQLNASFLGPVAADVVVAFTMPVGTGVRLSGQCLGLQNTATTELTPYYNIMFDNNVSPAGQLAAATVDSKWIPMRINGTYWVGATAGNFQFQMAQLVNNATGIWCRAGSWIRLQRIK